jgi:hypothetical protein
MTVADLQEKLSTLPADAIVILAVEVINKDEDDQFTVEEYAENVSLRPDFRVQIGDSEN